MNDQICISNSNLQTKWEIQSTQSNISKDQLTPGITKMLSAKWIRVLESDLNNKENLNLYNKYKLKLELIYDDIAEGIRLRTKSD